MPSEIVDSNGNIHFSKDLLDHLHHPLPLKSVQPAPNAGHAKFFHSIAHTVVSHGLQRGVEGFIGGLVEITNFGHLTYTRRNGNT